MADYSNTTDVRANTPEGGFSSSDYDTIMGTFITVASRLIDKYLGVEDNYFYPSSDEQTRYFDGTGGDTVSIDDTVSISAVAVAETGDTDYTTWYTSDNAYYVKPYNYSVLGLPISHLVVDHNGDEYIFPAFPRAVSVTGIFGYSTTPPDVIKKACEVQTIQWLMRGKQAFQNQGANETMLTDAGGELSKDVKMMLLPLMLYRMGRNA